MSTKKNNELLIDESFVVKPKGKPDEAVKGRLLKWRDSCIPPKPPFPSAQGGL